MVRRTWGTLLWCVLCFLMAVGLASRPNIRPREGVYKRHGNMLRVSLSAVEMAKQPAEMFGYLPKWTSDSTKNTTAAEGSVLAKKSFTGSAILDVFAVAYLIPVMIGTTDPANSVFILVDTGSFEMWVNPNCTASAWPAACDSFGRYDPTMSPSAVELVEPFSIQYGTGSVNGMYWLDNTTIAGVTVAEQKLGVAKDSTFVYFGVMGLGYGKGYSVGYSTIVDSLASQGLTNSRLFALSLGLETTSGSVAQSSPNLPYNGDITFGGVNTGKYAGCLVKLAIQPPYYQVSLLDIALSTGRSYANVTGMTWPMDVILDSGTTLSLLPQPLVEAIAADFGGVYAGDGTYTVDCAWASNPGTVDFDFGSIVIHVPLTQFIWQPSSGQCTLGVASMDSMPFGVLGASFLRGAYVVFDQANNAAYIQELVECSEVLVEVLAGVDEALKIPGACGSPTTCPPTNSSSSSSSSSMTSTSLSLSSTSVLSSSSSTTSSNLMSSSPMSSSSSSIIVSSPSSSMLTSSTGITSSSAVVSSTSGVETSASSSSLSQSSTAMLVSSSSSESSSLSTSQLPADISSYSTPKPSGFSSSSPLSISMSSSSISSAFEPSSSAPVSLSSSTDMATSSLSLPAATSLSSLQSAIPSTSLPLIRSSSSSSSEPLSSLSPVSSSISPAVSSVELSTPSLMSSTFGASLFSLTTPAPASSQNVIPSLSSSTELALSTSNALFTTSPLASASFTSSSISSSSLLSTGASSLAAVSNTPTGSSNLATSSESATNKESSVSSTSRSVSSSLTYPNLGLTSTSTPLLATEASSILSLGVSSSATPISISLSSSTRNILSAESPISFSQTPSTSITSTLLASSPSMVSTSQRSDGTLSSLTFSTTPSTASSGRISAAATIIPGSLLPPSAMPTVSVPSISTSLTSSSSFSLPAIAPLPLSSSLSTLTPSSSTLPPVGNGDLNGYQALGCFATLQTWVNTFLIVADDIQNSPSTCTRRCSARLAPYAAMWRTQCYCLPIEPPARNPPNPRPAIMCNIACPGDATAVCGGDPATQQSSATMARLPSLQPRQEALAPTDNSTDIYISLWYKPPAAQIVPPPQSSAASLAPLSPSVIPTTLTLPASLVESSTRWTTIYETVTGPCKPPACPTSATGAEMIAVTMTTSTAPRTLTTTEFWCPTAVVLPGASITLTHLAVTPTIMVTTLADGRLATMTAFVAVVTDTQQQQQQQQQSPFSASSIAMSDLPPPPPPPVLTLPPMTDLGAGPPPMGVPDATGWNNTVSTDTTTSALGTGTATRASTVTGPTSAPMPQEDTTPVVTAGAGDRGAKDKGQHGANLAIVVFAMAAACMVGLAG